MRSVGLGFIITENLESTRGQGVGSFGIDSPREAGP